ncbi:MAG: GNAT family N-acetyltransferase [Acidimicrobiales bacterium]
MRIVILDNASEIATIRKEWDELAASSASASIYNTSDHLLTAWRHLTPDGTRPWIVTVRADDGELIAAVPLRFRRRPLETVLEWLVTRHVDRLGPLVRPGFEDPAWRLLLPEILSARWDQWSVAELERSSSLASALLTVAKEYPVRVTTSKPGEGMIVDLSGSWDGFLAAHKSFRRRLRRFEAAFPDHHIDRFDRPDDVAAGLERYLAVTRRSWKYRSVGVSESEVVEGFYAELLPLLAVEGRTAVSILRVGDDDIAADITHRFGSTAFMHSAVYADDWADHSPGTLFTGLVLRDLMSTDLVAADFLTGYADYVRPWASSTADVVTVTIARSTVRTRALDTARAARAAVAGWRQGGGRA